MDFAPKVISGIVLTDDLIRLPPNPDASASVTTTKIWRLCVPAAINHLVANKHRDHLLGYDLDGASFRLPDLVKGVEVTDQFGTSRDIEIIRRDLLMVPSAVSLSGPVDPIADPELDDFACYRVRGARRPPTSPQVVIDDEFVAGLHLDVKQPMRLCLSAERPPGHARLDPADALMCYRTRPSVGFRSFRGPDSPVYVANSLPDADVLERVNHLRELCVPAVVTLP